MHKNNFNPTMTTREVQTTMTAKQMDSEELERTRKIEMLRSKVDGLEAENKALRK